MACVLLLSSCANQRTIFCEEALSNCSCAFLPRLADAPRYPLSFLSAYCNTPRYMLEPAQLTGCVCFCFLPPTDSIARSLLLDLLAPSHRSVPPRAPVVTSLRQDPVAPQRRPGAEDAAAAEARRVRASAVQGNRVISRSDVIITRSGH